MHEKALYRDLRAKLIEVAEIERARSVGRAVIWVGALSHVTEPALRAAWPEIVRGTRAEGAALDVAISSDPTDPRAQGVILQSIVVPGEEAAP